MSRLKRLTDSISRGNVLVPHLEQALLGQNNIWPEEWTIKIYNKERIWDGYFHPSTHAEPSELQLYYMFHPEFLVKDDPHTADTIMNFQVGSAYHSLIQSMLIHLGYTTPDEVEVKFRNEEHNCAGAIDVRKIWLPDGRTMPVEIKSAAYLPPEPSPQYIKQFQIYMDIGCEEPQEEGMFLFLSKVTPHKFREFIIKRDERLLEEVYSKWNRVLEAIAFDDPSSLAFPCHTFNSKSHVQCPARHICPLGEPTV